MSVDVAPAPRAATEFVGRPRQLVQLLRAGSTTPERLRRVAAGLVVGCLLTALTSVLGGLAHTDAVHDSGTRIAALDSDAAELYRSLADADATATRGYVSGGLEPAAVRARYDDDVARAADRLVQAASRLPVGDPAAVPVTTTSAVAIRPSTATQRASSVFSASPLWRRSVMSVGRPPIGRRLRTLLVSRGQSCHPNVCIPGSCFINSDRICAMQPSFIRRSPRVHCWQRRSDTPTPSQTDGRPA